MKPINVHPCANGALITATYHDGDIIVFERGGLALGYVNARPVVHGEWMYKDDDLDSWYECSVCGYCNFHYARNNFCPNCGAEMRVNK